MAEAKRERRSAQAIAQERLDGAKARLALKEGKVSRLENELTTTRDDVRALKREVGYLAQHPALPEQVTETEQEAIRDDEPGQLPGVSDLPPASQRD